MGSSGVGRWPKPDARERRPRSLKVPCIVHRVSFVSAGAGFRTEATWMSDEDASGIDLLNVFA